MANPSITLTHYHTMPHFDALKIYSCKNTVRKGNIHVYEIPVTRTNSLSTPDSKHFYLLLRIQHFYHTVRDGESIGNVNPLPHNAAF